MSADPIGKTDADYLKLLVTKHRRKVTANDASQVNPPQAPAPVAMPSTTDDDESESWREAFEDFTRGGVRCPDIPLNSFVNLAAEFTPLEWRWPNIFPFARLMRAHPELRDATAYQARDRITEIFEQLGISKDGDWNEAFPDIDGRADLEADFVVAWEAVRYVPGESALDVAVRASDAKPVPPVRGSVGRRFDRFVSIAFHLQEYQRERPILLPVETLAALLKCTRQNVTNYRKLAMQIGLLEEVAPYRKAEGRATEFQLNYQRLKALVEPP